MLALIPSRMELRWLPSSWQRVGEAKAVLVGVLGEALGFTPRAQVLRTPARCWLPSRMAG